MSITITHIDTACVLIDINGYRILTDPTLDRAGKLYYHGYGTLSRKTGDPAIAAEKLGKIDLVLLSHHQHKDNFDHEGKALTGKVPLVLSTRAAARTMTNAVGLKDWDSFFIKTPLVPGLKVTATPAQHHPWWVPGFLAGKVIGFAIEYEGQEEGVLYISGDTVYFPGLTQIADRFRIGIGVFHVGAVQFRYLTGKGRYTMNARDLVAAVALLEPRVVIPVHYEGWSHFKEKKSILEAAIYEDPALLQKTVFLRPGIATRLV